MSNRDLFFCPFSNSFSLVIFAAVVFSLSLVLPSSAEAGPTAYSPEAMSLNPEGNSAPPLVDDCEVYKVEVIKYGEGNPFVEGEDVFAGSGAGLDCLTQVMDNGIRYEGIWDELLDDLSGHPDRPNSIDDVRDLVKVWSIDSPEVRDMYWPWKYFYKEADEDIAEYVTEVLLGGYEDDPYVSGFIDNNCRPISSNDSAACKNIQVRWINSPISLIWDESYEMSDMALVQFPLDPARQGWWYTWKASEKSPLLVYDPKRTRSVKSGSQLFGNHTFGGPQTASLSPEGFRGRPLWKHGYEALATLDENGDGEISGPELEVFALWFDKDRDGKVDSGEIKALSEVDVTALYYTPDSEKETGKDIYATRGYKRMVDGQEVTGASVDWYADRGRSKFELISKQMGYSRGAMKRTASANNFEKIALSSSNLETATSAAKASVRPYLDGVWVWKIRNDHRNGAHQAKGVLTFSEGTNGLVTGRSYIETPLRSANKKIRGMLSAIKLSGARKDLADGRAQVDFALIDPSGARTSSVAYLSQNGFALEGKSTMQIPGAVQTKPMTVEFSWTATRFVPPDKKSGKK